jgi:hypothetical protein
VPLRQLGASIVLSGYSKTFVVFRFIVVVLVGVWATGPGPSVLFSRNYSTAFAQYTSGQAAITFPTTIQWVKQRGVSKYRLQIADDEDLRNIFYDGPVVGERYTVRGLAPGYYFWRVAPAERHTGAFLKPVRFFVSGGVVISGIPPGSRGTSAKLPARPTSKVR